MGQAPPECRRLHCVTGCRQYRLREIEMRWVMVEETLNLMILAWMTLLLRSQEGDSRRDGEGEVGLNRLVLALHSHFVN